MTTTHALKGGCLCGRVRYEADAAPFHETICHCADCRRAVGAPTVAWFSVPRAAFRFSAGTPAAYQSSAHVTRRFCGTCGTALTYESTDHPDEIDITTCSLDDAAAVPPKDHSFSSDKVKWDVVCDGLRVFPRLRPR
jgi:hypothetical protein